jgi:hypothetical protein
MNQCMTWFRARRRMSAAEAEAEDAKKKFVVGKESVKVF